MERRTRIDIIHDILNAIRAKGGKIKPTHLMYRANMSHKSLNKYLKELEGKGLIASSEEKGHTYYSVTEKGIDFMKEFQKMQKFQQTFGL